MGRICHVARKTANESSLRLHGEPGGPTASERGPWGATQLSAVQAVPLWPFCTPCPHVPGVCHPLPGPALSPVLLCCHDRSPAAAGTSALAGLVRSFCRFAVGVRLELWSAPRQEPASAAPARRGTGQVTGAAPTGPSRLRGGTSHHQLPSAPRVPGSPPGNVLGTPQPVRGAQGSPGRVPATAPVSSRSRAGRGCRAFSGGRGSQRKPVCPGPCLPRNPAPRVHGDRQADGARFCGRRCGLERRVSGMRASRRGADGVLRGWQAQGAARSALLRSRACGRSGVRSAQQNSGWSSVRLGVDGSRGSFTPDFTAWLWFPSGEESVRVLMGTACEPMASAGGGRAGLRCRRGVAM